MARQRATELLEAGDLAGAIAELRAAVAITPADAELLNLLGTALVQSGDLGGAEEAYRASIAADSLLYKPHANLANLHTKRGRHAEAAESLRAAVTRAPDAERLWRRLGESLDRDQREEEANQAFEHGLRLRAATSTAQLSGASAVGGARSATDLTPALARRLTPIALHAGLFDVALGLARRARSAAPEDDLLARIERACQDVVVRASEARALIDPAAVALREPPAPELLAESGSDRLHIGGSVAKPGWKVLNALPGDHVDYLGDMRDLSQFADASFDMIYASHVLEHVSYQGDLWTVARSLARILRPGGRFFVSVPDLEVLCRLFDESDDERLRFRLMRMMFGGQTDAYDFHYVGLWDAYLREVLQACGFATVHRVASFGLFEDTSALLVNGVLISLNMIAVR